eukprot:752324-Hanusia_phi.AAC.2
MAARALDIFSWGKHPMHANVNSHLLSKSRRYSDHISWSFKHTGDEADAPVVLQSSSNMEAGLDTPEKIYQQFQRASGMGMVEDVEHWEKNGCNFAAGRKLLFTKEDKKVCLPVSMLVRAKLQSTGAPDLLRRRQPSTASQLQAGETFGIQLDCNLVQGEED